MPTDDDYGRRERLLLHQHTAAQFGPSASPSSQSQTQSAHPHPHPHSHSHGHGHGNVQNPGASSPGGPGGLATTADRYLQDRVGQAEEHAATARYGAAGSQRQLHERYNNNNEKPSEQQQQQQQQQLPPVDGSYGGQSLLQDRYPQLPGLQSYQHQFAGSPGVAGRLGLGTERFSHRYGEQHHASGFHLPGPGFDEGRYANPGTVLLSSELFPSPPSPAPASDRFIPPPPLSPTPSEKYASSGSLAAATAAAATTPAAKERLLGGASPVLRSSQGIFTPGIQPGKEPSRYGLCGLPTLASLSSASPVHGQLAERFACGSRVVSDKTQPSGSPRHERSYHHLQDSQRYLTSSPNPEGAHQRYGTAGPESTQTACRRLRLLPSGSPTAVPVSRYHATTPGYANGASQTSPCGDHHSHGFSPTGDPRYGSPAAPNKNPEKYLTAQTSKPLQAGAYNPDRYQAAGGQNQSQERASRIDRFHRADPRYSPGRSAAEKSYQLSLPKPKDRFPSTGRVVAPGAERAYASAHTPVERYVPQPPAEILYPGYVDLYVPPAAHTPADRYVPAADPGDPYMRRDLGFHHHYRLPPPGYPYHHQAHYRGFRGFAYAAPPPSARLGGSPGSSSSASSTNSTAQREFSTSPLLRPKVQQQPRYAQPSHGQCCPDNNNQAHQGQRGCCPPGARHSLPSCVTSAPVIPAQNNPHASWQPSPSSGTTSTSTVSSSGQEGGVGTSQSISMYAVGAVGAGNGSGSGNGDENGNGNGSKISESLGNNSTTTSPPVPLTTTGNFNLARSASAPTGPRPVITAPSFISHSNENQNQRLQRTMSRTEAIKSYIRRETATFFGVDEDSEAQEKQRWLERRRRMASRKYGALLPEHRPPDPDITRDVPDFADIPEGVTLRRWHQPVRRKDSVARMTLSGLSYMVTTMTRHRPRERDETRPESRSFPPGTVPPSSAQTEVSNDEEEERFFEKPAPPSPASTRSSEHPTGRQDDAATLGGAREDEPAVTLSDLVDAPTTDRDTSEELVRFTAARDEGAPTTEILSRRPRHISKDRYTSRMSSWRRSREPGVPGTTSQAGGEAVTLRRQAIGGTRISPNTIDRIFDNSNRRQYGMGIVGRFFGRSFRKSVAHKPDVKKQLDDIEDQRPFFTYWITTVQVLILVISLACYGFGPFGFELNHRSGLVLVTSLSLQQVDYQEPANFWIGPRAADLIHLGAKFAPCMRRDIKILKEIDVWRERERDTACCIRNDDSGCVQSSKQDCSNTISTWKKWGPGDSGPGGRISGSVCGLDPKFCDAPASVAPYEWPDDITKWPICRKTNPFNQRFSKGGGNNQNTFPIGRHMDKMAEHMVCEVIGHPCCIGIHGMCRITTKEYCDFVHGYFHEEASLCSQVECLHDVCGMIPFLHPEWPDQFYRLFTSIFLHAGIFHLFITLCVQYFFMRDLEKLTGSLRIGIIYFTGGLAGNLASAIFVPYRAEVGPAGAHFALLATLVVEVLNSWPMLKHPRRALAKLLGSLLALLLLGALPWIDNYAHLFGFVFGFLAAYAVMPFISFGKYDRRRKILLIWVCLVLIIGLFAMLLALFYNVPAYECEVCKLFTCIPFTKDFCASQNINFKKEEPV